MTLDTYIRPADLQEALAALAQPGPKPQVVAGCTDYVPMTRKLRATGALADDGPRALLDLS